MAVQFQFGAVERPETQHDHRQPLGLVLLPQLQNHIAHIHVRDPAVEHEDRGLFREADIERLFGRLGENQPVSLRDDPLFEERGGLCVLRERHDRRLGRHGQADVHGGSAVGPRHRAREFHGSAVQINDLARDGQAEARAAHVIAHAEVALRHFGQDLGRDTHARVAHRQQSQLGFLGVLHELDGDRPVGGREFDGVAHDVEHHALDLLRVAPAEQLALRKLEVHRDELGVRLHLERLGPLADHRPQRNDRLGEHQRFVLDLPQVQDVVDGGQQAVAVRLQPLEIVKGLFGHGPDHAAQHIADRVDHRREGRAQLVRHVRDELHARAVVGLQALNRILQRALRLLADRDVAHEETELALRIHLDLVDRDLGRERGAVGALAPRLDQRVLLTFQILVALGFFVLLAIASFFNKLIIPGSLQYHLILAGFLVVNYSIFNLVQSIFNSERRFWRISIGQILDSSVKIAIVFFLLNSAKLSISSALFANIISSFLALTITSVYHLGKVKFKIDKPVFSSMIIYSKWIAISRVFNVLVSKIDVLLINLLLNSFEAGIFSAANRVTLVFSLLISSLNTVVNPRFSAFNSKEKIKSYVKKLYVLLIPFAVLMFLMAVLAGPLVTFVYGKEYASAIPVFQAITVSMVPYLFSIVITPPLLYSYGQSSIFAIVSSLRVIVMVALEIVLIPRFGAYAPAIANGATNTIATLYLGIKLHYLMRQDPPQVSTS